MQEVAHIIILNIEKPKAAASMEANVPLQKKVRNRATMMEAMRHSGEALRQRAFDGEVARETHRLTCKQFCNLSVCVPVKKFMQQVQRFFILHGQLPAPAASIRFRSLYSIRTVKASAAGEQYFLIRSHSSAVG